MKTRSKPAGTVGRRRIQRGISAYALAKAVGTTPSHISRIERGEASPAVDLALRIADALGCDVRDLFAPAKARASRAA
jgi:transcriptional regulator with XRE-family HTH domain